MARHRFGLRASSALFLKFLTTIWNFTRELFTQPCLPPPPHEVTSLALHVLVGLGGSRHHMTAQSARRAHPVAWGSHPSFPFGDAHGEIANFSDVRVTNEFRGVLESRHTIFPLIVWSITRLVRLADSAQANRARQTCLRIFACGSRPCADLSGILWTYHQGSWRCGLLALLLLLIISQAKIKVNDGC